jgi:hypothetical protein
MGGSFPMSDCDCFSIVEANYEFLEWNALEDSSVAIDERRNHLQHHCLAKAIGAVNQRHSIGMHQRDVVVKSAKKAFYRDFSYAHYRSCQMSRFC